MAPSSQRMPMFNLIILNGYTFMFTGIVDHTGRIEAVESHESRYRFKVSTRFSNLVEGESIAVNGICLTVTETSANAFSLDLSPETLNVTTARSFAPGKLVNLERALTLSDRIGGHLVMGHVDQTARVTRVDRQGDSVEAGFEGILPQHQAFLLPKGSVAVDGVSLTLNAVQKGGFTVMLIPHTLERTTLRLLNPDSDSQVNLEFDWMVKAIFTRMESIIPNSWITK